MTMTLEEWKKRKKKNEDLAPVRRTGPRKLSDYANEKGITVQLMDPYRRYDGAMEDDNQIYEKQPGVFKAGAFSDGYQFGDVLKTAVSTIGDLGVGIAKGAGHTVEGIADLATYGATGIAGLAGQKDASDFLKRAAQNDVIGKSFAGVERTVDKNSLLAGTADSVAEGLGQVGLMILSGGALGAGQAATTAMTTGMIGASAMGSGMNEAYQSGATDGEAAMYGAISGTAEAVSEMIFGGLGKGMNAIGFGKGLSSADDMLAKKVSGIFKNQIAKNLVQFGIKAGAEGTEEVMSGIASAIGKKVTYMNEEELLQLVKDEKLLEQFLVGTATSAIAQSGFVPGMKTGSIIEANKARTDFVSGDSAYSKNEQKVFDAEYQNRIKEREADGKKLSRKEKSKLYDEVGRDLKRGAISIDTIESVLGGDTYKSYKDTMDSEEAMKKEYEELRRMKKGDMNDIQIDRLTELKKVVPELEKTSSVGTLREKLHNEVDTMTQNDSLLRESYNEKARRGQKYEADLSGYASKQRETIQKAMDSGILNNTNRTHEFVDMIAKISADKGVSFDFTNNAKLKESGFGIEGKTINGFVKDGNVTLNLNSNKAMNAVVGHEITHVLEGTEMYAELQKAVKAYATTKGEYDSRFAALTKLYEGVKDANVDAELTADLIGDYLFTDEAFVRNLSSEQPGIFKRIYDEIKYFIKTVTAGSKEAKELEKVKKVFEEAYAEGAKSKKTGKNHFSISGTLDDDLQSVLDNTFEGTKGELHIGKTSDFLVKNIGAEEFEMLMPQKKAYAAMVTEAQAKEDGRYDSRLNYHGLGKEKLLEALREAENPVITYVSENESGGKKRENRIVLVTEAKHNGEYIVVVNEVSVRGLLEGKKIDANATITVFEKQYIENALKIARLENRILSVDKKRSHLVARGEEVQFLNSLNNNDFNNNIADFWNNVNYRKMKTKESSESIGSNVMGDALKKALGDSKINYSISEKEVFGFKVKSNAKVNENLLEELSIYDPDAEVDADGNVTVYHRTSRESAEEIKRTGIMKAKEDALFFSSKSNGYNTDYGEAVIKLNIPSTLLEVNDIFDGEVHFDIPLRYKNGGFQLDVKNYLIGSTYSLSNDNQDLAPVGPWKVQGKELALEDIAPIRADIPAKTLQGDIAPIRSDIQPENEEVAPVQPEEMDIKQQNQIKREKLSQNIEKTKKRQEQELQSLAEKRDVVQRALEQSKTDAEKSYESYQTAIDEKQQLYDSKKDKNTKAAGKLLNQINELRKRRDSAQVDFKLRGERYTQSVERLNEKILEAEELYGERVERLSESLKKMNTKEFKTAEQRKFVMQQLREWASNLIGDTTNWKDKSMGIKYQINTLRRNLRDIIPDRVRADAIYEALQGEYNRHEALLNQETNEIKKIFKEMKINRYENVYIQMRGEKLYNPDCQLRPEEVQEYYEAHKDKIDAAKVDNAIEKARELYDSLYERVNAVLREQGFKEIPYREGYFPHFIEEEQGRIAKLLNWKGGKKNVEIPTDIAGMTEFFNPERTYQSFDKHREGDATEYNFMKGLDSYVQGALDWVYHIEDIQKRRAFENEIRYRHSDKGKQEKIDAINNSEEYDAEEAQAEIDRVLQEANNPLGNFLLDFHNATNNLAGKKSATDRAMEYATNRHVYTVAKNLSGRVNANMVVASISSAGTNFIPIFKAAGEVHPGYLTGVPKDTVQSYIKDDGLIEKSAFLTNRLKSAEALYQTNWDKIGDAGAKMMEIADSFSSQVVWRGKYKQNLDSGMSETEAIRDADNFAAGLMADRSRGNMPTIFNAQNFVTKLFTSFQLEVANEYGYLFKDLPKELEDQGIGRYVKSYASIFIGSYIFNKMYSALVGRDAALDPIGMILDFIKNLTGDEDDRERAVGTLAKDVAEELPFVGGLIGGGRMPISAAIPYGNPVKMVTGTYEDLLKAHEGEGKAMKDLGDEWSKPLFYGVLPMGGGQLRKSMKGLEMYLGDHPTPGSYTSSGNLRFPVDTDPATVMQAVLFGQYANKNARQYFDEGRKPLSEDQTQEFVDMDLPIADYWKYRDGLKKLNKKDDRATMAEKFDYVDSLDLTTEQKNVAVNNLTSRKDEVDMEDYGEYGSYDEFNYANAHPGWYQVIKAAGGYDNYEFYKFAFDNMKSANKKDRVFEYINKLNIPVGQKMLLFKMQYPAENRHNVQILDYLKSRDDMTYEEKVTVMTELGFVVGEDGNVRW